MSFFHTKSVAQLQSDAENSKLSKNLSVFDLTFLGVGGIIGAGVFVLTGIAAARYAGPGVAFLCHCRYPLYPRRPDVQ